MANLDTIGGLHYEMMRRCYNEKCISFKDYGAKGIKVCEEWHDRENFRKWCRENGWNKELRLNRFDSSKDYSPENCYFGNASSKKSDVNSNNRKRAKEHREFKDKYGIKNFSNKRIYRIYISMHTRCENEKSTRFEYYGARKISVCDEWSGKNGIYNFIEWAYNNGYAENLTIDRIDNNGNYCPENCQWVTMLEQAKNKRNNVYYEIEGGKYICPEIAREFNVDSKILRSCLKKEKNVGRAVMIAYKKSCKKAIKKFAENQSTPQGIYS